MGGDITAESRPAGGSSFSLTIPASVADPRALAPRHADRRIARLAAGSAAPLVLVADDHEESRAFLVELLRGVGFLVQEAADGAEVLELCRRAMPDIVLMDLNMPELDGYQAARAIRQLPGGGAVPIVAVSAGTFGDERSLAAESGMRAMLLKPFRVEEALVAVAESLGIEYEYDEQAAGKPGDQIPSASDERLGKSAAAAMRDAAIAADYDRLLELVTELEGEAPVLGRRLRELASTFDYGAIMTLIAERSAL
jgi:CheY-like chemotaxis protein